jgi:polar amino acid transport system substrate-binding protein
MGVAKSRGDEARIALAHYVETVKVDGTVAAALARHHIEGVSIAPPATK